MAQVVDNQLPPAIDGPSCPTDAELRALAEGALAEPALETILHHLMQCSRCEDSLARLNGESGLAGQFPLSDSAQALVREPECLRMQQAAGDLMERLASGRAEPDEVSTDKTRLSTDSVPPGRALAALDVTTTFVPSTPRTIGRYKVQSVLGEGGYGQVYLAYDPQLDRQVAIKVAKFGSSVSRRLIDAFLAEAKILAKLKHPGIVAVHDAGFDPAAGCYIVMEYVEGQSLKERMKGGKIPHEQAAKYIAQAAEALNYVHKRDLVHRDLKPSNLLLDSEGNVKVADFGLAIFEEEQRKHGGEIAGTIAYCSPEQIRGEVPHLDGRTDIWSLGVILYELLTGRRPFSGPNITDEILHRPPKPPRQYDDSIPPRLERIVLHCLAQNASGRYATARDLKEDLQRLTPSNRVPPLVIIVVSACAAIAALGLGIAAFVWPGDSPDRVLAPQLIQSQESLDERRGQIPYDVDQGTEPFAPLHLFRRSPRLVFPLGDQDQFVAKPKLEEVFLSSSDFVFAGAGRTQIDRFRLSVDISKPGAGDGLGKAGLFVGYQSPDKQGHWNCQCVLLCSDGPESSYLVRKYMEIKQLGTGEWAVVDQTDLGTAIVEPTLNRDSLELTVVGGRVRQVHWCRQLVPSLIDGPLEYLVKDGHTTGEFGVANYFGAATFHNLTFTDTRSP